jgi:hypothetical protein
MSNTSTQGKDAEGRNCDCLWCVERQAERNAEYALAVRQPGNVSACRCCAGLRPLKGTKKEGFGYDHREGCHYYAKWLSAPLDEEQP